MWAREEPTTTPRKDDPQNRRAEPGWDRRHPNIRDLPCGRPDTTQRVHGAGGDGTPPPGAAPDREGLLDTQLALGPGTGESVPAELAGLRGHTVPVVPRESTAEDQESQNTSGKPSRPRRGSTTGEPSCEPSSLGTWSWSWSPRQSASSWQSGRDPMRWLNGWGR